MATKRKVKHDYRLMPKEDALRVGCKVSWRYYKDEATAKAAGVIAQHNARIDESLGYDFGYQSPGTVRYITEGQYAGMWEVCES